MFLSVQRSGPRLRFLAGQSYLLNVKIEVQTMQKIAL
jgi:hypothetical protein